MRPLAFAVLITAAISVAAVAVVVAAKVPVPAIIAAAVKATTAAGAPPIPQDPDAIARHYADMLAYNRATLGGAYDRVGRRNPKWDAPARAALEDLARQFSYDHTPGAAWPDPAPHAAEAIRLGCDDPLVKYAHVRYGAPGVTVGQREDLLRAAANELNGSNYPPARKAAAAFKFADALSAPARLTPRRRAESLMHADFTLMHLPAIAAAATGRPVERDKPIGLALDVYHLLPKLGESKEDAHLRIDRVLASDPALRLPRLILRGQFLVDHAWEARGNGLASTVTADGWQLFHERLAAARAALEEAWALSPHFRTADVMITVELGAGGGDRAAMERWFTRAMTLNPCDIDACRKKLYWLQPKWHGSEAAVLEFGEQCRATGNARAGLPIVFVEAHESLARPLTVEQRPAYYAKPALAAAIKDVYTAYFEEYPDHAVEHARYAGYCTMAGRTAEAAEQFALAGTAVERMKETAFFPRACLTEARAAVMPPAVKP